MHSRSFMDYHRDRFEDHSLIIYRGPIPVCILPANQVASILYSHQGLSYAGFIFNQKLQLHELERIFASLKSYCLESGIEEIYVKQVPDIYSTSSQDIIKILIDSYGAKLVKRDLNHVIQLPSQMEEREKRWRVRNSNLVDVKIRQEKNFQFFWEDVLMPNLMERHNVTPVHTLEEIQNLADQHPDHIQQFNVYYEGELLGGTTLFIHSQVVHAQYISTTANGRHLKALDYLFFHLFKVFQNKNYFSLGISSDPVSGKLNKGLVQWKESFGARPYINEHYILKITQTQHAS